MPAQAKRLRTKTGNRTLANNKGVVPIKQFWSTRIRDLTPYTPGEQPKEKLIKLNTNENPYPPSPKVLEALRNAVDRDLRLYPDPEGTRLRDALAGFYGVSADQVFLGNGSDEVLAFCFQAFFSPGETIVFPDVTYSFYPVYCRLFDIPYQTIPLDDHFAVPVPDFCGDYRGVVLANPNAPTGKAIPVCKIRMILEGNPKGVVLVDEAYVDFGGDSAVSLVGEFPNLIVVKTMSKSRSLAGLRIGYALGHPDLIAALNCVKNSFNSYTLDRLALVGGEAAIRDDAYFRAMVAKVTLIRSRTALRLKQMGFCVIESTANFLFVTHETAPARELFTSLRKRGILVRYFDLPRIDNHLRITIGTEEEMDTFCTVLEEILEEMYHAI